MQLFPDIDGFYGLAKAYFVGDEQTAPGRLDELEYRLELVREKVSISYAHRIEYVGEVTRELCGDDNPGQIGRSPEPSRIE